MVFKNRTFASAIMQNDRPDIDKMAGGKLMAVRKDLRPIGRNDRALLRTGGQRIAAIKGFVQITCQ